MFRCSITRHTKSLHCFTLLHQSGTYLNTGTPLRKGARQLVHFSDKSLRWEPNNDDEESHMGFQVSCIFSNIVGVAASGESFFSFEMKSMHQRLPEVLLLVVNLFIASCAESIVDQSFGQTSGCNPETPCIAKHSPRIRKACFVSLALSNSILVKAMRQSTQSHLLD